MAGPRVLFLPLRPKNPYFQTLADRVGEHGFDVRGDDPAESRLGTLDAAIGGLWAYFHRSEVEPLKLFQLGIVAPAMITGMINASNVSNQAQPGDSAWLDLRFALISSAHAADGDPQPPPPGDRFSRAS